MPSRIAHSSDSASVPARVTSSGTRSSVSSNSISSQGRKADGTLTVFADEPDDTITVRPDDGGLYHLYHLGWTFLPYP